MLKKLLSKPINKSSVSDLIIDKLIAYICQTGLKPGDRIPSDKELLRQLKLSKAPLRQALHTLQDLGIFVKSKGLGLCVGESDLSELVKPLSWSMMINHTSLEEVMEARCMLEVDMAGLAAQRATLDQIALIEQELIALTKSLTNIAEYKWDYEFHMAIARAANNRIMYNTCLTFYHLIKAFVADKEKHPFQDAIIRNEVEKELPAIYEAIRKRDVLAAKNAMAAHLNRTERTFGIHASKGL